MESILEFDGDDEAIALYLEAEVMEGAAADDSLEEEDAGSAKRGRDQGDAAPPSKRARIQEEPPVEKKEEEQEGYIESGNFGKLPPEIFPKILKSLSAEDLSSCAKVCRYLRRVASDEPLWKRLYCQRWGLPKSSNKSLTWKQFYFEQDKAYVTESLRNSPAEFREFYLQMQVAKRAEAPPSKATDERWVIDEPREDEVAAWKRSHKLAENFPGYHACSGQTCSYHQIGDVYICENTGRAHVCGDACRETVMDWNEIHVCTVSGRCFEPCMFSVEDEQQQQQQQEELELANEAEYVSRYVSRYEKPFNCVSELLMVEYS